MIDDDLRALMDRDVACRAAATGVATARAELWSVESELTEAMAACWAAPRGASRRAAAGLVADLDRRRTALVEQVEQGEQAQRALAAEAEAARPRHYAGV